MKSKSINETRLAILRVLQTNGPMQDWQVFNALGKDYGATLLNLVKSGHIKKDNRKNDHPNPHRNVDYPFADYYSFVRELETTEELLEYAVAMLRAAGYTVGPPVND